MITVKNWEELSKVKSNTHILEIDSDLCCGWVKPIAPTDGRKGRHYLSTHTFYAESYKWYEEILNKCGFNVKLISWG